jgi:hypothetical protein
MARCDDQTYNSDWTSVKLRRSNSNGNMAKRGPKLRYGLYSRPSVVGGILPLVYLLPTRPSDPENEEYALRLPRELLKTIGEPIGYRWVSPRIAGGKPTRVMIWRAGPRPEGANTEERPPFMAPARSDAVGNEAVPDRRSGHHGPRPFRPRFSSFRR